MDLVVSDEQKGRRATPGCFLRSWANSKCVCVCLGEKGIRRGGGYCQVGGDLLRIDSRPSNIYYHVCFSYTHVAQQKRLDSKGVDYCWLCFLFSFSSGLFLSLQPPPGIYTHRIWWGGLLFSGRRVTPSAAGVYKNPQTLQKNTHRHLFPAKQVSGSG